jgi:hypothetical protein
VTEIRKRWSESEDSVLRSSLAAKVGAQNIADFLDRDLNEVVERIAYLTKPEGAAVLAESSSATVADRAAGS